MSKSIRALALAACLASSAFAASGAHAQTALSTPFVIHETPLDGAERTAAKGQALLLQPTSTNRAARLDAERPGGGSIYYENRRYPAGTLMFGAYAADKWSYCAVPEHDVFWRADFVDCFVDNDSDGRFDAVRAISTPFGSPLLVLGPGEERPIPALLPYTRIPIAEGPTVEFGIGFWIMRPSGRGAARTATHIVATEGFKNRLGSIDALTGEGRNVAFRLRDGQTATIRVRGAVIEILGVSDDDAVRYRVIKTMPSQIDHLSLTRYA